MMAFHIHHGKYEVFTLESLGMSFGSLANTNIGFCELDHILKNNVKIDECRPYWTFSRLREMGISTDSSGPNRLYYVCITTQDCESANPSTLVQ